MIKYFLLNILLSLVWIALSGQLNYANFLFGFFLGFAILWLLTRNTRSNIEKRYFYKVPRIFSFFFFFLYEMLKANIEVTREIILPKFKMKPGIVEYKHDLKSDFEITMFSNFIALTPGTMVLRVSPDKKIVYIHALYLQDQERFKERMKNGLERRLIEVMR
ncbi:MAG: Na+/H+ antiporter subunit E [Weeksellaceae bacterium]|jgi:multicomponent Na+:H+ antiporter subunit E